MSKLLALLLVVGALILLFTAMAAADGPFGCSFSGSVKLDGAEVTDGTLITAVIDGVEYHTHTSTGYGYSTFSITIRPPEGTSYADGTKVVLKVNGHPAAQTAIYKAGANTRLDLTASSKAVVPIGTWLTPLLILTLLAAVGLACYLLFRTRLKRRKVAEPVTAVQTQKIEAEPRARYVWDSDKLAWVQATEPATRGSPQRVQVKGHTGEQQSVASSLVTKKPAIKRNKVAKSPRRDTSLYGKDA